MRPPVVARVRQMGYRVTCRELSGDHVIPREIASAAARWFAGES